MAGTRKKSEIEAEGDPKRGDEILKRMLQGKPKPHSEMLKERKANRRSGKDKERKA